MQLSILICTIEGREIQFSNLFNELNKQISENNLENDIEILYKKDKRGDFTIGHKRQKLLEESKGKYIIYIDDDDMIHNEYCKIIINVIKNTNADMIGYKLQRIVNTNKPELVDCSLKYKKWFNSPINEFSYVRDIDIKVPIKRELVLKCGFRDISLLDNLSEDYYFAKDVREHIKTEFYIDEVMYYYNCDTLSIPDINIKYGVKKCI